MTETTVVTLYCVIDDFINTLAKTAAGQQMLKAWRPKRGPHRRLSLSEILTLNIMRFHSHIGDLKAFVHLARSAYQSYFPHMPNYENILKATNKAFPFIVLLLQYILSLNRQMNTRGVHFIDSTTLRVCENWNISKHRVTRGYASRGKNSKGWFYGFKLHGVCDAWGNLESIRFSAGHEHDSQQVESLTEGLHGLFVGDAGYLLRLEVFQRLFEKHKHILSGARKNMKRLISHKQGMLFRKRNIIETVWGVLKERYGLESHLARSITGLFRHYCYSLLSQMTQAFLPSCQPQLAGLSAGIPR
jgi:hypothetical protein